MAQPPLSNEELDSIETKALNGIEVSRSQVQRMVNEIREHRSPPKLEPEPYEIIPDLDLMDFIEGGFFGSGLPVSEKKRQKLLKKMADDMMERGEPFIWNGVRNDGHEPEPPPCGHDQGAYSA